jgi:hypothetical protein
VGLADSGNRDSVLRRSKYRTADNDGIRARIDRLSGAFTILSAVDLDDRIRMTSQRWRTYSISSVGLAGSSTTPAFLPRSWICERKMDRRGRLGLDEEMIGAGVGEGDEVALRRDDDRRLLRGIRLG